MNIKIRSIKRRAASVLQDHMGTAILGMLAVFGINGAGSLVGSALFAGSDILSLILYQVFLFIVSLIAAVFSAGLSVLYLHLAREEAFSLGDLFYFFRTHPDRVIIAAFVLALVNMVVSIPYYYYGFTAEFGDTIEAQTRYMIMTLALLFLSQALYILLTIPFSMTYFLLADDPELTGLASLKASAAIMNGAKKSYLLLMLSFVPAMLLSVFTLYIALLWIMPHMNMSETVFYLKLLEKRYYAEQEARRIEETLTEGAGEQAAFHVLPGEQERLSEEYRED